MNNINTTKMILYICALIFLNNYLCQTEGQTEGQTERQTEGQTERQTEGQTEAQIIASAPIENVYIDTLIQQHLEVEKNLWTYIYQNSSARNVDISYKIETNQAEILSDRYLQYVMADTYRAQFVKYVDFNNVSFLVENYQQKNLSQPSFMTWENIFVSNNTNPQILFEEIEKDSDNSHCRNWSTEIGSTNQNLFMFYEFLSANFFTSYMKSQHFNMLQVIKNGFVEHNPETLRSEFNFLYNQTINVAKEYLRTTDGRIWMCDRNASADYGAPMEITNFLQGYVDNEMNLNSDGSCWQSCTDYKFTKNYGCSDGTFCHEQMKTVGVQNLTCNGTIVDCDFIDRRMEICPSNSENNRRYEYVNHRCTTDDRSNNRKCNENGRNFGRHSPCEATPIKVKSIRRYLLTKCDYCFCYCDEKNIESDRYFSLQPVVTDTKDNMVVSGVGLIKQNGIFSWKITQSKLLDHGQMEQLSYDEENNFISNDFKRTDNGTVDGVHYHTLSWQNRSIDLDTVVLPPGYVVTGIRFIVREGSLNLQVQSTRFDFNTGNLLGDHEWVSKINTVGRTSLLLDHPEPMRFFDEHHAYMTVPDFTPNKFIKFRPSDPDADAGQSTVPFIDIQMVRPKNLTPLSGVGIYYKGKPGLGGYIAPTIVVYDMSTYIGNR